MHYPLCVIICGMTSPDCIAIFIFFSHLVGKKTGSCLRVLVLYF